MRAERRPLGGPIVLIAAALAATLSPAGVNGAAPLRPWSAAITYGFTTEALRTKREMQAKSETSLMPDVADLDDVPFFSDIAAFVQRWKRGREPPPPVVDHVDLSRFPKQGCTIRGNMALCRTQVVIDKPGFKWKADVAFCVRYSSCPDRELEVRDDPVPSDFVVRPNVTETLLVDGVRQWKGILPARRPDISFGLKREEAPPQKAGSKQPAKVAAEAPMNIVAVAPSAASSLPMELAVKLTNLKVEPRKMSANVVVECKKQGAVLASYQAGKFCVPTDS